jgi:hypothetical protein
MKWAQAAALGVLLAPAAALPSAVIRIDDEKTISIAVGLRASAGATTAQAPTAYDVALDGAILALGGQFDPTLKLALNGGRAPTGELRILDAFGMWEPKPYFKLWVGRFLVATDRATLTGPFFAAAWDAPLVAAFPSAVAGRSDGLSVWGTFFGGSLKYYAGVFRRPDVVPTKLADLMASARVAWSIIGAEPAYYANGSFFGARDVLTLGVGGRLAPSSVGPPEMKGDLWGFSVDAFFEKTLGPAGVLTLEAALYRYVPSIDPSPTVPGGTASYELAGWIPPISIGAAKLQLVLRHQHQYSEKGDRVDATVNVLANGHFLRFALMYWHDLPNTPLLSFGFRFGAQLIL